MTATAFDIAGSPTDPMFARHVWDGPIIDADVHAVVPTLDVLKRYLASHWIEFIDERAVNAPFGGPVTYPPNAPTTERTDWRPADRCPAASSVEMLRRDVLDPLQVECAILTCSYGVDSIRHPDFAVALASAVNDWIAAEWLEPEPRLRGSITVPARHPEAMVNEIRRTASDRRFVQVTMPVRSDRPYGNRIWHPVLQEMAAHGLVMALHWGGSSDGPPSPTGWPSWFVEEYAAEQQVYMAQITSLIAEGAFQAVPELMVAVGEIGFAWVPSLTWRLHKEWKGLRRDIPWVRQSPTEIIREHLRFTVAPMDVASSAELGEIVSWLDSEDMLLFASDYPHAHEVPIQDLLNVVGPTARPKLMADNARALYRLGAA